MKPLPSEAGCRLSTNAFSCVIEEAHPKGGLFLREEGGLIDGVIHFLWLDHFLG